MAWAQEDLFIANYANSTITVYTRTAQDDTGPLHTLAGSATQLNQPTALAVDLTHDELVVSNADTHSITVYARTASGDTEPLRTLTGSTTGLSGPFGLTVDLEAIRKGRIALTW